TITSGTAIQLHQLVPNVKKSIKIANRISRLDARTQKMYLRALSRHPRANHTTLLRQARLLAVRQTVPVTLPKTYAKRLEKISMNRDEDPEKLAQQIVVSWLSKRKK
ncbi:MAG: hypothetical protein EB161_02540, partial [Nitrosopumilaceae archaeon]|nr:hypothetical protein [Nitrosopumilaceae archaeon]